MARISQTDREAQKINKIKTKHKSLVKKDKNKTTGEQTKRPKRT